jgi:hypothetical protein
LSHSCLVYIEGITRLYASKRIIALNAFNIIKSVADFVSKNKSPSQSFSKDQWFDLTVA